MQEKPQQNESPRKPYIKPPKSSFREREAARKIEREKRIEEHKRSGGFWENLPEGYIKLDIYNLFWIFISCSFIFLIVETLVSWPIDGVFKDRAGLVWGPFSPLYGLGAVLLTIVLDRLYKERPIVIFLVSMVVGGVFEYLAGWFWYTFAGIVAWDYSDMLFNIGGFTCLEIDVVWGIAGLLWIKILLPWLMDIIRFIPWKARKLLTVVGITLLIVDAIVTMAAFSFYYERISGEPVEGVVQSYFAQTFDDAFMEERFQTMTFWPAGSEPTKKSG